MARNTLGKILSITSFGESHGPAVGVVIDGFPAGFQIDEAAMYQQLSRRKPGQSEVTTNRKEEDKPVILSGIFEGITTGSPICIIIENKDQKPADYEKLKNVIRPGHADYTYNQKYGVRDYRGGGRSSARITAGWVVAGALADQFLQKKGIEILAFVDRIYNIQAATIAPENRKQVDKSVVRCPDLKASKEMENAIAEAKSQGDSLGGSITCIIRNCPVGLGEPVFGKLHAKLGKAMLSINAVKGVEFGDGFASTYKKGSENNDVFFKDGEEIHTRSNHSGGMLGGISNGEEIYFKVGFKPASSIAKTQESVDVSGNKIDLNIEGRHDPCVLPRAVPIVEALTAVVLMDLWLENQLSK
ncbi:MAG: chorismate synthase [Bacteroidetes bacterium]|nr:chorismate synthase [Bacteroidota bacterium]